MAVVSRHFPPCSTSFADHRLRHHSCVSTTNNYTPQGLSACPLRHPAVWKPLVYDIRNNIGRVRGILAFRTRDVNDGGWQWWWWWWWSKAWSSQRPFLQRKQRAHVTLCSSLRNDMRTTWFVQFSTHPTLENYNTSHAVTVNPRICLNCKIVIIFLFLFFFSTQKYTLLLNGWRLRLTHTRDLRRLRSTGYRI